MKSGCPVSFTRGLICCFDILIFVDNCVKPLGMESGEIPDAALSQTTFDPSHTNNPVNARLNKDVLQFPYGWATSMDPTKKEWIQIDLGSMHKVCLLRFMLYTK